MTRRAVLTLAIAMMVGIEEGGCLAAAGEMPLSAQVSAYLWERLLSAGTPPVLQVAGNRVRSGRLVMQFYARRLFWPAWSNEIALLLPQIDRLLQALHEADHEGLQPRDYHLTRLESLLADLRQQHSRGMALRAAALADLDLLLTDALLTYGAHLLYGRMTPQTSSIMFDSSEEQIDLVDVLQRGLETDRLTEALHSLLPRHSGYTRLKQLLAQHRQAVKTKITAPPGDLAAKIAQNMERWRWLPQDLGQRYILVDVPSYMLEVVEHGQPVMTMRVVVGKPSWPTPVLSAILSHVVLNPDWRVPPSIAAQELLPILRTNPGYLAQHNMKVSHGTQEVDPRSINWWKVSPKNFPYRLRQEPGPKNPLGTLKFMFANRFQVYLHDTPSRALFAKPERAFSHGCVRVEKPTELAEYVLRGVWSRERILASVGQRTSRTVALAQPLPIYLVYRTVWVRDDGAVQWQPDIYGYDEVQEKGTS